MMASRLDRVVPARGERAASRDPPGAHQGSSDRAVLADRVLGVVRAGGGEAALPAERSGQREPVHVYQSDQEQPELCPGRPRGTADAVHLRVTCARESNCPTSATSSCVRAPTIAALATTTMSYPSSTSFASSRHAARRMRRARLRSTAPPILRPATNATDPVPGATNTITRSP